MSKESSRERTRIKVIEYQEQVGKRKAKGTTRGKEVWEEVTLKSER